MRAPSEIEADTIVIDQSRWQRVFYFATFLLVALFFVLQTINWLTSAEFHTIIESSTTQLAFIAGSFAMLRYYSKKSIVYLFIGVGFIGAGALDGYHAVVTSAYFKPYMPSDLIELIPWRRLLKPTGTSMKGAKKGALPYPGIPAIQN